MKRLVPFLMLMYVVSFLDRANIGFAKQAMQASLGITERVYALSAGLFFLAYSCCGFPSNLVLHRIGAKIWISLLMVCWGLVSMATMFVHGGPSFYALRLLLGATEAGFFPGVILYLTYWFPARVRGRMLGLFYLGVPLSLIIGGPLSGFLLEVHYKTILGWQWMFLVEGMMAVAVGLWAFSFLDNRPANASWLSAEEKHALTESLAAEENLRRASGPVQLLTMVRDPKVLGFLLIYTLMQMSTYGAVFYLPAEISSLLNKPAGLVVGLVSAIPWIWTAFVVVLLPALADRRNLHRELASLALLVSGCASFIFPTAQPLAGLAALSIAVSGFIAVQPLFWTFPTGYLADRAAAGGIALVGVGNLGGFIAPNVKVWAEESFHSSRAGLYLLAGLTLLNAVLILFVKRNRQPDAAS